MDKDLTDFARGLTVNELIARHPETIRVFDRFGIDSCCGGAERPEVAARRDGADPAALCEALRHALTAS